MLTLTTQGMDRMASEVPLCFSIRSGNVKFYTSSSVPFYMIHNVTCGFTLTMFYFFMYHWIKERNKQDKTIMIQNI